MSQFSEGQLVSTGCQSDDSEISEELAEGRRPRPEPVFPGSTLTSPPRC